MTLLYCLLVIGVLLLLWGLRGKVTSRSANCRKCRYDLSVLDPLPATCPQCECNLAPKRATKRVHRKWRKIPILLGLFSLFTAFLWACLIPSFLRERLTIPYAPNWVLIHLTLPLCSGEDIYPVDDELCDRMQANAVSDDQILFLARKALRELKTVEHRIDQNVKHFEYPRRWNFRDGAILLDAFAAGLLTKDEEIDTLRILTGHTIMFPVTYNKLFLQTKSHSIGSGGFSRRSLRGHPILDAPVTVTYSNTRIDDRAIPDPESTTFPFSLEGKTETATITTDLIDANIPLGQHTLHCDLTFTFEDGRHWTESISRDFTLIDPIARYEIAQYLSANIDIAALHTGTYAEPYHGTTVVEPKNERYLSGNLTLQPDTPLISTFHFHEAQTVIDGKSLTTSYVDVRSVKSEHIATQPKYTTWASLDWDNPPAIEEGDELHVIIKTYSITLAEPGIQGVVGKILISDVILAMSHIPVIDDEVDDEHAGALP